MAMPAYSAEWTFDRVQALPDDGNRYEVIGGELFVTPPPNVRHQFAITELVMLVGPYVRKLQIGRTITAPADVIYGPRNAVQPDLFVSNVAIGTFPRDWPELPPPYLIVEVVSPSTRGTDRRKKRTLYQRKGVAEYWIVDTTRRTIERWRPDSASAEVLTQTIEWQPLQSEPPLVIDLVAFFGRVSGPSA